MALARTQIVTAYHFNKSSTEEYERLMRSLRASERELDGTGQIILVASGEDAEDPSVVESDALPAKQVPVVSVPVPKATHIVDSVNAGFERARELAKSGDELICSVQSSAVIQHGWLRAVRTAANPTSVMGVGTRLVVEEQPHYVRSDGHCLIGCSTYDRSYLKRINDPAYSEEHCGPECRIFPCLSACAYKVSLVRQITERYGSFVSKHISRNGDCTDIAIRATHALQGHFFVFAESAVATKRWSTRNPVEEIASQLVVARLHYAPPRTDDVLNHAREKSIDEDTIAEAITKADEMIEARCKSEREIDLANDLACY